MNLAPWLEDVVTKYRDSGEVTVPDYVANTRTGEQRPWFGYKEDEKLEMILNKVHFFSLLDQYL